MSKNIAVSDEVYRVLKREKGRKSFSELIKERLKGRGKIEDVAGARVLDRETYTEAKRTVGRMSSGTMERVNRETT